MDIYEKLDESIRSLRQLGFVRQANLLEVIAAEAPTKRWQLRGSWKPMNKDKTVLNLIEQAEDKLKEKAEKDAGNLAERIDTPQGWTKFITDHFPRNSRGVGELHYLTALTKKGNWSGVAYSSGFDIGTTPAGEGKHQVGYRPAGSKDQFKPLAGITIEIKTIKPKEETQEARQEAMDATKKANAEALQKLAQGGLLYQKILDRMKQGIVSEFRKSYSYIEQIVKGEKKSPTQEKEEKAEEVGKGYAERMKKQEEGKKAVREVQ